MGDLWLCRKISPTNCATRSRPKPWSCLPGSIRFKGNEDIGREVVFHNTHMHTATVHDTSPSLSEGQAPSERMALQQEAEAGFTGERGFEPRFEEGKGRVVRCRRPRWPGTGPAQARRRHFSEGGRGCVRSVGA